MRWLILLLGAACLKQSPPPTDTPVRYVYCFDRGRDCRVTARFATMENCEQHWKRQGLCCTSTNCAPCAAGMLEMARGRCE